MASFDNVLYIIGNGFDLHHGVMSSYKSFAMWLQRKNRALYEKLNNVCRVESLWRDFEGALPYVDRAYFLEMGDVWLPEGWTEDDGYADEPGSITPLLWIFGSWQDAFHISAERILL